MNRLTRTYARRGLRVASTLVLIPPTITLVAELVLGGPPALIALCTPAVERSQERFLASLKPADRANFMRLLAALVHLNNEHSRAPLRLSDDVA